VNHPPSALQAKAGGELRPNFVDSAGWQRLLFIWPWLLPISMIIGAFAGGAFMMKDMSVSDTGEKIEAEG
jgi:hypothetical protein